MSTIDRQTLAAPIQVTVPQEISITITVAVLVSARALRESASAGRISPELGGQQLASKITSLLASTTLDPRIEFRVNQGIVRVMLVAHNGAIELCLHDPVQVVRERGFIHLRAGERNNWALDSTLRGEDNSARPMYIRTCLPGMLGLGGGRYETIF